MFFGFGTQAQFLDSLIIGGLKSYENGNYTQAITYYDSAIVKYPNLPYLYVIKAEAIFNSGYAGGENLPITDPAVYAEAIQLLDKALEISPSSADTHASRGLLNTIHQKYELAVQDFSNVLLNSFDFDKMFNALSDRASAYSRMQQYEKAHTDYSNAIELKPDDLSAWVNMSVVYNEQGQTAKAEEVLQEVLAKDDTYTPALNNLGLIKAKQEKYQEANELLQKALIIDSRDAVTLNNYGFSLGMSGKVEQGMSLINQSLKLYQSNAFAYRNIGLIYLKQGDKKIACENFNKAKELYFKASYGEEVNELIEANCK